MISDAGEEQQMTTVEIFSELFQNLNTLKTSGTSINRPVLKGPYILDLKLSNNMLFCQMNQISVDILATLNFNAMELH